jgi:hypothetical protein
MTAKMILVVLVGCCATPLIALQEKTVTAGS